MEDIDAYLDMTYLSNLLTGLDLLAFLPLLDLWELKFIENEAKVTDADGVEHYQENAYFYFDPRERKPKIHINRLWARENLRSPEEVVTILLHECLHFLLGYYGTLDPYLKEAWECFINQTIAVLTRGNTAYLDIVRRTFALRPFPTSFRCDQARPKGYVQGRVYHCLYDMENPGTVGDLIDEKDVMTTAVINSPYHPFYVPKPCFLLDPVTLGDFFAAGVPESERLPRTKEEWEERVGSCPRLGVSVDPDSPLGKLLAANPELLGSSVLGEMTVMEGELSDLPPDQILPPDIASDILVRVHKDLVKEITDLVEEVKRSPTPTEAEKRYNKKIPAKTKRDENWRGRAYRTLVDSLVKEDRDGTRKIQTGVIGSAGGSGCQPTIYEALAREKLFLRKSSLRKDLERVASLTDQGRMECLFRSKVRKAPAKTPKPSFQRDRLASSLLSQGAVPAMYRSQQRTNPQGLVHVYIDVSGSVSSKIQQFLSFLEPLRDICHPVVKVFSTFVYEANWNELVRKGVYKSDGGNDFTTQLQHLKDNHIRLAVFITDGYMTASEEMMAWARKANLDIVSLHPGSWSKGCQLEELSTIVADLSEYIKDWDKKKR